MSSATLEQRGVRRDLEAYVIAARFDRAGTQAAFALGDGTLWLVDMADREAWHECRVHDGAVLTLAEDARQHGFVSGGDDGLFRRTGRDGAIATIADFGSKWVEHAASYPGSSGSGKGRGVLACAAGRRVHVFNEAGETLKTLEHPSTVTGLAFDAKGKRVAASHYNGATLWFVAAKTDAPRRLEWKGSHTGILINPDGDTVVTSMQENALHGWRLSDEQHMRMSGYPAKSRSIAFSRTGKWLATSGADAIVLWPFFGGGPMGKAPTEIAGGSNVICTSVACHPEQDMIVAGFDDGRVVLADIPTERILPVLGPGNGSVSTLAWSPDGAFLAMGTGAGFAALIEFGR